MKYFIGVFGKCITLHVKNMGGVKMSNIKLFEDKKIRSHYDEKSEKWFFSVVDILTESVDTTTYERKLKQRLKAEGNETVTNCHGLKMTAEDGK